MENKMKISLDMLELIQKVESPPFLFTRIQQKIANLTIVRYTPKLTWTLASSFVLVIGMNITVLFTNDKESKPARTLVNTMNLMSDNSLYK